MPHYVFFLGRHAPLSAAECWRMLVWQKYSPQIIAADPKFLIVGAKKPLPSTLLERVGGSDRIAVILGEWDHEPEPQEILGSLPPLPSKWMLGLSMLGVPDNVKRLGSDLKKLARAKGSRLKFVLPSGKQQLNAAQVLFNALHREPNAELTLLRAADVYYVARTIAIQDIQAYELRDTRRPSRDAKVGMLPPKLAQIMLNLAVSELPSNQPLNILDPFCGGGTVLQEGWLAGHQMIGSDASSAMIAASGANLKWLTAHFNPPPDVEPELAVHDVQQPFPRDWENSIDAIVTEPYLGRPLTSPLPHSEFERRSRELGRLYTTFFRHAHPILKTGGQVVFALPAVKTKEGRREAFSPLPGTIIDEIEKCGYHMKQLVPPELTPFYEASDRGTLLYHRPDALVARELTLWEKEI